MTILYIPGLGDDKTNQRQRRYLEWRYRNSDTKLIFYDSKWLSDENYNQKWQRLEKILSTIDLENTHVIGVSAGGSLLVRAVQEYPSIGTAHAVSSKLINADGIGENYRKRAPALYDAVLVSQSMIDDKNLSLKTTIYRPLYDNVVPLSNMIIPNARRKRNPMIGQAAGIIWFLLFMLPKY